MFKKILAIVVLMFGASAGLEASDVRDPLAVVPSVDLSRYAGKWYEIARLPNRFHKKCSGRVTATYTQFDVGQLIVINECQLQNGQTIRADGRARRSDGRGPNSIPQAWGDYSILELASDYSYSVVGTPDRRYLWILSRSPYMDDTIYNGIVTRIAESGFESSRLLRTRQSV
jgi:apolipoprotein D and lipocalin family protein